MLLNLVIIASTIGAQAAAEAKRRQEQGLPPLVLPPPAPPTWKDKIADIAFWALVFSPVLAIAAIVGMSLYIVLKIAFARQGIAFP